MLFNKMIPYGRQTIDNDDIQASIKVLQENEMLTTGKYVSKFEQDMCNYVGCKYGIAVNSGTAALHLATFATNIQENDEIIVPAISFVASANCVLYERGKPVFCDIDETMCLDVKKIESLITSKTKAIVCVDMCGQACNYDDIKLIADKYNLIIIQDAAHSIGGRYKEKKIGSFSDITCFSFHPVKNITTCEGGMMVTNSEIFYKRALAFRTHGICNDFREREKTNSHYYEMHNLGYNYRIPDILCALGSEQLKKLDHFVEKRNQIADQYNKFFLNYSELLEPIKCLDCNYSAYHIYVIRIKTKNRDQIFKLLKEKEIGVNVHYMPIYLHPYYQKLGYKKGICPNAENVYKQIITLPIFPLLSYEQVNLICHQVVQVLKSKE